MVRVQSYTQDIPFASSVVATRELLYSLVLVAHFKESRYPLPQIGKGLRFDLYAHYYQYCISNYTAVSCMVLEYV
jgi:hypothetical protein